jgi:hypothetical protein
MAGGAGDAGGTEAPAPRASTCTATAAPEPTATQAFQSLTARLVDPSGAPATDAPVSVCGFDLCLVGQVDSDGTARVVNAPSGPPLRGPALKIGDGLAFAELAFPLPEQAVLDLGTAVAIRLPDVAQGVPLSPGATATAAGVTLTVAPGAAVTFDAIAYPPDQRGLRAAPIALARPPLAVEPATRIELAYALVPQGTTFCPPAALDLPNTPAWPVATDVEVLVHGVDLAQSWAPYGGWAVVATGRVSDDGARIRTAAGSGLPVLSTIGVRRR